jgi:hypothetical protein
MQLHSLNEYLCEYNMHMKEKRHPDTTVWTRMFDRRINPSLLPCSTCPLANMNGQAKKSSPHLRFAVEPTHTSRKYH